jgi:uncharacterized RDD family membrane protein YckC
MTQGYGPEDPNQPGERQQPSYPPPPSYGPPGPEPYGPPPPGAYGQQPGYGAEQPGYYMGHQLANWLQRVGAFLIDQLVYGIPLAIAFAILGPSDNNASAGAGLFAILLWFVSVALWVYNRCIQQGRTGQSWGKQALGLKLLRMDNGQPVGGGIAFVRELAHLLDSIPCYIGYLWPLWDNRRQTFADKVTNTVVIAD